MKTTATLQASLATSLASRDTAESTNAPALVSVLQRAVRRATEWAAGTDALDPRDIHLAASVDAVDYERRLAEWEAGQALRRELPPVY